MTSPQNSSDTPAEETPQINTAHEHPLNFQFPKEKLFQVIVYVTVLVIISIIMLVIAIMIAL